MYSMAHAHVNMVGRTDAELYNEEAARCVSACLSMHYPSHVPETTGTGEISFGLVLTEDCSLGVDWPDEARSVRPRAAVRARVLYNRGRDAFFLPPPTTFDRLLLRRKEDFFRFACKMK